MKEAESSAGIGTTETGFRVDESHRPYDLEERLLEFSADVIRLVETFYSSRASSHIANQLIRSSTSPLANHGEAQAAESDRDFVHKLKLCLKELRETQRWLKLVRKVPLVSDPQSTDIMIGESDELIRIFVASVRTAGGPKTGIATPGNSLDSCFFLSKFNVGRSMFDVRHLFPQ